MELDAISKIKKANTAEDIFENVSRLLSKRGVVFDQDQDREYALDIIYKKFESILIFKKNYEDLEIKIHTLDGSYSCLEIQVSASEREDGESYTLANIDSVSAGNCLVPTIKTGTWIMGLANKIICILGVQEAYLVDESSIKCGNRDVRLLFLRVYRGNYSYWYENFGYTYKNREKAILAMKQLNSLPAKTINVGVKVNPKFNYKLTKEKMEHINYILEKYPPQDLSIGEYMSSLWDQNCELYADIADLLFFTIGPWSSYIRYLTVTGESLFNLDVCKEI